jgi:hypothetical protein
MLHTTVSSRRTNVAGRYSEIIAAAATAAGKFVLADWLGLEVGFLVGAVVFWVLYVLLRYKTDPSILRRWGFRTTGLSEGAVLNGIAFLVGAGFCVAYALITGSGIINWNLALIMLLYPAWGLIQQFLLVGIFADNVMALSRDRATEFVVVMLAALLFSAIHIPETPLMIATFFLGAASTLIFFRTRNLWLNGVLHGWFASLFYFLVMEKDPLAPLLNVAFESWPW